MLIFYKGTEIVAVYENESLPPTLHPECDSAIVPASSISFRNAGAPVFVTGAPDPIIRTVTVTLGGKPMPVTWADRAAILTDYLYAVDRKDSHFSVVLATSLTVTDVSKSEAIAAVTALESLRPGI